MTGKVIKKENEEQALHIETGGVRQPTERPAVVQGGGHASFLRSWMVLRARASFSCAVSTIFHAFSISRFRFDARPSGPTLTLSRCWLAPSSFYFFAPSSFCFFGSLKRTNIIFLLGAVGRMTRFTRDPSDTYKPLQRLVRSGRKGPGPMVCWSS